MKSIAVVCGHAGIIFIEQSEVISDGITALVSLRKKQLYVLSGFAACSCDSTPNNKDWERVIFTPTD